MQKEENKFVDSTVFEGMTSVRAILNGGYSENNDRKIKEILYDEGKIHKISKEIGYLKAISNEREFTLRAVGEEYLNEICLGTSHGGMIAECTERRIPSLQEAAPNLPKKGFFALIASQIAAPDLIKASIWIGLPRKSGVLLRRLP